MNGAGTRIDFDALDNLEQAFSHGHRHLCIRLRQENDKFFATNTGYYVRLPN